MSRLADVYPMSFAAVQKHVAVLERAGLVTKERRGREQLVRTDRDAVGRARRVLDELETAWRGRVDRMADLLAQSRARTDGCVVSVEKDFDSLQPHSSSPTSTPRSSGCGSCGPTRGSWSAGGGRRRIRRPWRSTTWPPAVRSPTS